MASPGQPLRSVWTAAFYNRLEEMLRRFERPEKLTVAGPGFASASRGGTTIVIKRPPPQASGGGGLTVYPPWYPILTKNGSGVYSLSFYTGTIAGILASNWNSSIALTQGAVNYVYLAVTATAGNVTGATISASTSYPAIASAGSGSPPASFNIPLAIVDLTQASPAPVNVVGYGNIWATPTPVLFDTINTGALLTAPFTPWYNWIWGAGQD